MQHHRQSLRAHPALCIHTVEGDSGVAIPPVPATQVVSRQVASSVMSVGNSERCRGSDRVAGGRQSREQIELPKSANQKKQQAGGYDRVPPRGFRIP